MMSNDTGLEIEPGLYRHFRGEYYMVIGLAMDATNRPKPGYHVVYFSCRTQQLYVRDAMEFAEIVKVQGTGQARFKKMGD